MNVGRLQEGDPRAIIAREPMHRRQIVAIAIATARRPASMRSSRSPSQRGCVGGTGLVIGIGRGGAALGPILAGLLFSAGWQLALVAPVMACGCLVGVACLPRVPAAAEGGS